MNHEETASLSAPVTGVIEVTTVTGYHVRPVQKMFAFSTTDFAVTRAVLELPFVVAVIAVTSVDSSTRICTAGGAVRRNLASRVGGLVGVKIGPSPPFPQNGTKTKETRAI